MLIIVPARAGSKGIPGKNTRDFRGAPLVAYSFAAARILARVLGAEILCTTDDPKVADIAHAMGIATHARAADLASDGAGMAGVVQDACRVGGAARYVLLQPTSPLRITSDLHRLAQAVGAHDTVVSCTHPVEAPDDIITLPSGSPIITTPKTATRQERAGDYRFVDGAFYAGAAQTLQNGGGFTPPGTEFVTLTNPVATDIDTPFDWALAEAQFDWLMSQGVDFARP